MPNIYRSGTATKINFNSTDKYIDAREILKPGTTLNKIFTTSYQTHTDQNGNKTYRLKPIDTDYGDYAIHNKDTFNNEPLSSNYGFNLGTPDELKTARTNAANVYLDQLYQYVNTPASAINSERSKIFFNKKDIDLMSNTNASVKAMTDHKLVDSPIDPKFPNLPTSKLIKVKARDAVTHKINGYTNSDYFSIVGNRLGFFTKFDLDSSNTKWVGKKTLGRHMAVKDIGLASHIWQGDTGTNSTDNNLKTQGFFDYENLIGNVDTVELKEAEDKHRDRLKSYFGNDVALTATGELNHHSLDVNDVKKKTYVKSMYSLMRGSNVTKADYSILVGATQSKGTNQVRATGITPATPAKLVPGYQSIYDEVTNEISSNNYNTGQYISHLNSLPFTPYEYDSGKLYVKGTKTLYDPHFAKGNNLASVKVLTVQRQRNYDAWQNSLNTPQYEPEEAGQSFSATVEDSKVISRPAPQTESWKGVSIQPGNTVRSLPITPGGKYVVGMTRRKNFS